MQPQCKGSLGHRAVNVANMEEGQIVQEDIWMVGGGPTHQRVSPLNLTPQATFNTTDIYNGNSISIATAADRKGIKSMFNLLFFV